MPVWIYIEYWIYWLSQKRNVDRESSLCCHLFLTFLIITHSFIQLTHSVVVNSLWSTQYHVLNSPKATTGRLELRVLSLSAVLDTSEKDAKVGSSSMIFFVMMSWSVLICSMTEDIADSLGLYYSLSTNNSRLSINSSKILKFFSTTIKTTWVGWVYCTVRTLWWYRVCTDRYLSLFFTLNSLNYTQSS